MDKLDVQRRSENMRRIRNKNTKPEITLRSLLHKQGYRFRIHCKDLPGKPDIVFPGRRKVIFVHGCFWHQHSGCREGRLPGTRLDYWRPKLKMNHERDEAAIRDLLALGWEVMVIWDCEIAVASKLEQLHGFIGPAGTLKQ
jgi:DNA mismatch endonuclease, patch repair protein